MSTVTKILIVVNLILSVAVMGAAGAFLNASEDWKGRYNRETKQLKDDLNARTEALTVAQNAEREARNIASTAEKQRAAAEAERDTQKANGEVLAKKLQDISTSTAGLDRQFGDLRRDLDNEKNRNNNLQKELDQAGSARRDALAAKATAEAELARVSAERDSLSNDLDGKTKRNVDLTGMLEKTNTELTMYKVKYPPPTDVSAKNLKGVVLAADPKLDIYVISIGKSAGVALNDELTVYRGDHFVATVIVDSLDEKQAGCRTKKGMKKMDVQQGDQVTSNL